MHGLLAASAATENSPSFSRSASRVHKLPIGNCTSVRSHILIVKDAYRIKYIKKAGKREIFIVSLYFAIDFFEINNNIHIGSQIKF